MGIGKTSKTPIACIGNFVSDDMLKEIVSCTNKYIESKKMTFKRKRHAKTTSEKEIIAVICLLYFAGVFKSGHQNIYDLWNNDGNCDQIFHATMASARFTVFYRLSDLMILQEEIPEKSNNWLLSERLLKVRCLTVRKHTVCLPM